MRLMDELSRQLEAEESYFRQHLIREDLARLAQVVALARSHSDQATFLAAAKRIGWTPDDRRTHELKETLEPLLLAIRDQGGLDAVEAQALDARIGQLWQAFEQFRMDHLVGCLARVPRPQDATGG